MLIDYIAPGDCVEGIYATDWLYRAFPQFILIRNLPNKDWLEYSIIIGNLFVVLLTRHNKDDSNALTAWGCVVRIEIS